MFPYNIVVQFASYAKTLISMGKHEYHFVTIFIASELLIDEISRRSRSLTVEKTISEKK